MIHLSHACFFTSLLQPHYHVKVKTGNELKQFLKFT